MDLAHARTAIDSAVNLPFAELGSVVKNVDRLGSLSKPFGFHTMLNQRHE